MGEQLQEDLLRDVGRRVRVPRQEEGRRVDAFPVEEEQLPERVPVAPAARLQQSRGGFFGPPRFRHAHGKGVQGDYGRTSALSVSATCGRSGSLETTVIVFVMAPLRFFVSTVA